MSLSNASNGGALMRSKLTGRSRGSRGFSLVEVMIVIAIMFIVAAMMIFRIQGALPGMRANAALNQALSIVRSGRELSIAHRRSIQLVFIGNNEIQLQLINLPVGSPVTVIQDMVFENRVQFLLFPGIPDTPDNFGNASALAFGGTPTIMWLSDGTFVDANGQALNGTIFFGLPNDPGTQRAVSILGTTGRVRGYRWTGIRWIQ